ncbi:MAG: hypothetical protein ACQXXG_06165 [Candidatus Bathyarchaeia archaeon]
MSPQGKVTIYASNLVELGKGLVWVQEHLKLWMTKHACVEPTIYTQSGCRPVTDSDTVWIRTAPNSLEEWRVHPENPGSPVEKFEMTWKQVIVG